ncbi:MAG: hypothetical protein OEY12_16160, partial [Nitrospira sp.]|nr:hypothetical protein [Nitrospira sp.]
KRWGDTHGQVLHWRRTILARQNKYSYLCSTTLELVDLTLPWKPEMNAEAMRSIVVNRRQMD